MRRYDGHVNRVHPCSAEISPCCRYVAAASEDKCVRTAYLLVLHVTPSPLSHCYLEATEIEGVGQRGTGNKARVVNAGVDKSARRSRGGHRDSGQRSTKKQGWTTREWTSRHEETGVDNAGVSDRENNVLVALSLHA